jgi:hypothetical protein
MEEQVVNKSKNRSASYPGIGLRDAIDLGHQIKNALGKGPYSRVMASSAIGHPTVTGASATKIAAMVHFGVLIRHGNTYSLSPLSERVLLPTLEDDKRVAIIEMARTPKLYRQLLERFKGSSLPAMLKNILVREYKINESVSGKVVKTFQESIDFAGLLKNGVILDQAEQSEEVGVQNSENEKEPEIGQRKEGDSNRDNKNMFSIPLPSGITILIPESLRYEVTALGKLATEIESLDNKVQSLKKPGEVA